MAPLVICSIIVLVLLLFTAIYPVIYNDTHLMYGYYSLDPMFGDKMGMDHMSFFLHKAKMGIMKTVLNGFIIAKVADKKSELIQSGFSLTITSHTSATLAFKQPSFKKMAGPIKLEYDPISHRMRWSKDDATIFFGYKNNAETDDNLSVDE